MEKSRLSVSIADIPLTPFGMKSPVSSLVKKTNYKSKNNKLSRKRQQVPLQPLYESDSLDVKENFKFVNTRRLQNRQKRNQDEKQSHIQSNFNCHHDNGHGESIFTDIDEGSFIEITGESNVNVPQNFYSCLESNKTKFSTSSKAPHAIVGFKQFVDKKVVNSDLHKSSDALGSRKKKLNSKVPISLSETIVCGGRDIMKYFSQEVMKNNILNSTENAATSNNNFIDQLEFSGINSNIREVENCSPVKSKEETIVISDIDDNSPSSGSKARNFESELVNSIVGGECESKAVNNELQNNQQRCQNEKIGRKTPHLKDNICEGEISKIMESAEERILKWVVDSPFKDSSFGSSFLDNGKREFEKSPLINKLKSYSKYSSPSSDLRCLSDENGRKILGDTIFTLERYAQSPLDASEESDKLSFSEDPSRSMENYNQYIGSEKKLKHLSKVALTENQKERSKNICTNVSSKNYHESCHLNNEYENSTTMSRLKLVFSSDESDTNYDISREEERMNFCKSTNMHSKSNSNNILSEPKKQVFCTVNEDSQAQNLCNLLTSSCNLSPCLSPKRNNVDTGHDFKASVKSSSGLINSHESHSLHLRLSSMSTPSNESSRLKGRSPVNIIFDSSDEESNENLKKVNSGSSEKLSERRKLIFSYSSKEEESSSQSIVDEGENNLKDNHGKQHVCFDFFPDDVFPITGKEDILVKTKDKTKNINKRFNNFSRIRGEYNELLNARQKQNNVNSGTKEVKLNTEVKTNFNETRNHSLASTDRSSSDDFENYLESWKRKQNNEKQVKTSYSDEFVVSDNEEIEFLSRSPSPVSDARKTPHNRKVWTEPTYKNKWRKRNQQPIIISSSESDDETIPAFKSNKKNYTPKMLITPKTIPKNRSTWKTNPSSLKSPKQLSFLASLALDTPLHKCHTDSKPFVKNFHKTKEALALKLYSYYNTHVFSGRLPSSMGITWNSRMTKTAGFCYYRLDRSKENGRGARIELSSKVIDSAARLRDTLIHELCHAASWIISGYKDGHGPLWKSWASKAMSTFPELPIISRCHSYEIKCKYTYKCTKCGYSIGRHSKSLDVNKKVCGYCRGTFVLVLNNYNRFPSSTEENQSVKTPRTPGPFALFVKENYGSVKRTKERLKHGDVMKELSQQFALLKTKT